MFEVDATCAIFIISFLLFIYLLNKTLWQPIAALQQGRQENINHKQEKAKQQRTEAKELKERLARQMQKIREQQKETVQQVQKESKQAFEKQREAALEHLQAQKETQAAADRASREDFRERLAGFSAELAPLIGRKLSGVNL